jgi:2-keto-4-pentenoate hydratase
MTDIAGAASALLESRRSGHPLDALPAGAQPQSMAEAYAIQDAQMHALGAIGGWKVGAKSPDAEPACASLPKVLVMNSPQVFAPNRFPLHIVEAELAFTLAHDLPPRSTPYAEDEVAAAIGSVQVALELIASRYRDFRARSALDQAADFANNGALVVGPARRHDTRVDQRSMTVRVYCNDVLDCEVTGGNTAGDVFRLLTWLANHATTRCGGLRAGQVITTGSCIGMRTVAPGTRVRAAFDGLESVEASL